jgi:peptide deformylase
VAATGWNMHGEPVRVEGSHMLARAVQHEVDHLDGVLFVDRLDAEARAAALAVLRGAEWAGHEAYLPSGEPVPAPAVKVSPY